MQRRQAIGTEASEKVVGLAIAAEEHVLAVVDALAGLTIGERRRAAAEPRRLLHDDDPQSAIDEPDRGAQAGEARADHDNVSGHR